MLGLRYVALALWLFGCSEIALAGEEQFFVPKKSAKMPNMVIVLEHYLVERKDQSEAGKSLLLELARRLELDYLKTKKSVVKQIRLEVECVVILRDWGVGDPNFKLACIDKDGSRPFERLPETVDEVMKDLGDWLSQRNGYQRVPMAPKNRLATPSVMT